MQREHGPETGEGEMDGVVEEGGDPGKGKKKLDDGSSITKDLLAPVVDAKTREHGSTLSTGTLHESGGMSISSRSSTCGSGDGEAESLTDGDGTFSSDGEEYEDAIDHLLAELMNEDIHDGTMTATAGQAGIDTILTLFDVEGGDVTPTEASPIPV